MKWIVSGVGSVGGGMLGTWIGHMVFDSTATLFFSLLLSLVGTWFGWRLAREM